MSDNAGSAGKGATPAPKVSFWKQHPPYVYIYWGMFAVAVTYVSVEYVSECTSTSSISLLAGDVLEEAGGRAKGCTAEVKMGLRRINTRMRGKQELWQLY